MLGALLLVPLTRGNALGYVAMLGALCGLAFIGDHAAYHAVLTMPSIAMLIAAFVLLAISVVVVSGLSNDTLVAFNFTPFLLAIPAYVVFLRARLARPAVSIAALAAGGAAVALVVAAFQHFAQGNDRPGGWELSPIHFADLAVILGFMGLGGLLVETPPRWAWLLWFGPLAGVLAGILSGTRSALLVAGGAAVLALIFLVRRYRPPVAIVLGVIAGVVALAVALDLIAPEVHLTRAFDVVGVLDQMLSAKQVSEFTVAVRLDQYQAALREIASAPLFGHGWREDVQAAVPYMSPATQAAYFQAHWGYIHDELLNFTAAMGLLGALAWVLLMAYPIVALVRAPRSPEPAARNYMTLVAWAGIVISGVSDVLFSTELTKTFYCFIPGAIVILCSESPPGLLAPSTVAASATAAEPVS